MSSEKLFGDLDPKMKDRVNGILKICGELVATEARRAVQKSPRGGQIYKRPGGKTHKASAPGESPATDTGALVRSITVEPQPERYSVIIKCAPTIAPYAKALEYGTSDGRIQERPFLRPSLKKMAPDVIRLLRKALRETLHD